MLVGRLPCLRLTRSSHCNRKQSCARGRGLNQLAALECTSPLKHLVRVQPMRTCNQRHARAWLQCQIYDLPLLCNRPKSANPTFRSRCLFHDHMVRLKPAQMPEGKTTRLPSNLIRSALILSSTPISRGRFASPSQECRHSWYRNKRLRLADRPLCWLRYPRRCRSCLLALRSQ